MPHIRRRGAWPDDHQDAGEAQPNGGDLERVEPLAEEKSGEDCDPHRGREFDRNDLGKRNEEKGGEPGILRAIVDDIAYDMKAKLAEPRDQIALRQHDRSEDRRGDQAAEQHQHEDRNVVAKLAAGDGHGKRGAEPARHPESRLRDR